MSAGFVPVLCLPLSRVHIRRLTMERTPLMAVAVAGDTGKEPALSEQEAKKRRERVPLRYTEDFETPTSVTLDVIGVVRSPYRVR